MVKKSELAKNPTLTESADKQVWLSARGSLLLVALLSALPTPLSAMWGRSSDIDWQNYFWPAFFAFLWALTIVVGQLQLPAHDTKKREFRRHSNVRRLLFDLLLDTFFLTACLYLGGGAHNPFTLLYFIPITLSTFLSGRSPALVAIASVAGFGLLLAKTAYFTGHGPHAQHLLLHIKGMAVALAVAGGLLTFFMRQLGYRLAQQRNELAAMQRQLESDRAVTALGALSAGAAHELGTPLGTIQILVEELPHLDSQERQDAQNVILEQLARTKTIIHSMLSSELSAEQIFSCEPLPCGIWLEHLREECARSSSTHAPSFVIKSTADESLALKVTLPLLLIAQMVRELCKNAEKAQHNVSAQLTVELLKTEIQLTVKDEGPGMSESELKQAREPFISFSDGRGLGLFLIDVQMRQLGGQFELLSARGVGTSATLRFPYQLNANLEAG